MRVATAALLPLVACGTYTTASDETGRDGPTTTVRYGTPGGEPDVTTSPATDAPRGSEGAMTTRRAAAGATGQAEAAAPDGNGAIDLRVVTTNGTARAGVPVRLEGPATRTIVSDGEGHVRDRLPPGRYRAGAVVGCAGQLHVRRAGGADVAVAEGDTAVGDLPVEAAPRYQPAAPVSYSGDASWRVGEIHRVSLRLVDSCTSSPPPAPRDYAAARFVTNEVAEIVLPLSDAVGPGGRVEVEVRCTAEDDLTLELADVAEPASRTPIFTAALLGDQNPPFCVR
jgi:hypothetical protein